MFTLSVAASSSAAELRRGCDRVAGGASSAVEVTALDLVQSGGNAGGRGPFARVWGWKSGECGVRMCGSA